MSMEFGIFIANMIIFADASNSKSMRDKRALKNMYDNWMSESEAITISEDVLVF